jgi:hypothetical protein
MIAFTLAFALLLTIFPGALSASPPPHQQLSSLPQLPQPQPQPQTTTYAGSGASGVTDGLLSSSTFLGPTGVAVAPSGTVFVSDGDAQTIRVIRNGTITTIAGRCEKLANQLCAESYRDGRAEDARFSFPTGLAVGKAGEVYIADSLNRCIRELRNGQVTTIAGGPSIPPSDGSAGSGGFANPKALALDDLGNLYVADFGVGIRKITPSHAVTTVWDENKNVYSVSVQREGSKLDMAIVTDNAIYLQNESEQQRILASDPIEPTGEKLTAGTAYGVAIASRDSVVVTDPTHATVKYIRFTRGIPMMRYLVGGNTAATRTGGFRDGPSGISQAGGPLGIARMPNGAFLFADYGNRRIRQITGLDARSDILPPDIGALSFRPNTYRIAIVGNSFVYEDVDLTRFGGHPVKLGESRAKECYDASQTDPANQRIQA